MEENTSDISNRINHLAREEYGKLVSVLTRTFGLANMDMAEDVVQEAIFEAIKQWHSDGIPDNPSGWIYKVARNKAVNIINREKYKRQYSFELAHHLHSERNSDTTVDRIFTDKEIEDDQLRMMFTCCHPAVSSDSHIALTLKTLCGFTISEIAQAFLTTEDNIHKRLVRARKNIREAEIPFEVPMGKELEDRLLSVLETIYLMFNEGYNASGGEEYIRYELCAEAIRLVEIIVSNENISNKSNGHALLALMLFNVSRFKSRVDESDNLVDLEMQDRSEWDQNFIQKGLHHLELAAVSNEISIYHILATISAHHCTAKDFESTDWHGILGLYDTLVEIDSSPIVMLNRAVILLKVSNAKEALMAIDEIKDQSTLQSYLPYYTTKAQLHLLNDEAHIARDYLKKALELPVSNKTKSLIINKLDSI